MDGMNYQRIRSTHRWKVSRQNAEVMNGYSQKISKATFMLRTWDEVVMEKEASDSLNQVEELKAAGPD